MAVGEHCRRDGRVYRVVGADEGAVTLLCVTDGAGRRRATGEVVTVDRAELAAFEPAADPDAGLRPIARLRNLVVGVCWERRMMAGWLRR